MLRSVTIAICVAFIAGGCSSSSTTTRELENKPTGILQEEGEFLYLARSNSKTSSESAEGISRQTSVEENLPADVNRDKFLLEAARYIGVPYSYGGNTSKGLDCSGYVCKVFYAALGQKLPRSTNEQYKSGARIGNDSLRLGDLVFFNTTGRAPSHVGIYLEDGLFVHASVTEGVTLSSLQTDYYKNLFIGARRYLHKKE